MPGHISAALYQRSGRDSPVDIATRYELDGQGTEPQWKRDFPHPASCTMGIGYFPGIKRPGRGADPPPHLQCQGLKQGTAIPLPTLRALVAYKGGTFTFTLYQRRLQWKSLYQSFSIVGSYAELIGISHRLFGTAYRSHIRRSYAAFTNRHDVHTRSGTLPGSVINTVGGKGARA